MKLTFSQIKDAAWGSVYTEEDNGRVRFHRFTAEQEKIYKGYKEDFYKKTFATAGVKLVFKTDSKNLYLRATLTSGSSRNYFSFDLFVDGRILDCLDNYEGVIFPDDFIAMDLKYGTHDKNFALPCGMKTIAIYLPWSQVALIDEISIDDGAYFEAVKPEKRILIFGDSITQGYDALRPSNRYAAQLADALGAEEINRAIGGEIFYPPLAEAADDIAPDYISVAYGTNDWSHTTYDGFAENCKAFYTALSKNYPNAKIFAITPIWRKDYEEYREFGKFFDVRESIRACVADIENITVIEGFDLVPKDSGYYADLRLHPNDGGFDHYAENLVAEIKKYL